MINDLKKKFLYLVILLTLISINSYLLHNILVLLPNNTLKNNGNYIVSKQLLESGVMGSLNYFEGTQALSGEKLNLGEWYGFQEVIYQKPITLNRIDFKFKLDKGAYFYLIFNKKSNEFEAIRFSANKDFPSAFIKANTNGKFIEYSEFFNSPFEIDKWISAQLKYIENQGYQLTANDSKGQEKILIDTTPIPETLFGFRGSYKNAAIDYYILESEKEKKNYIIRDDFSNKFEVNAWSFLLFFSLTSFITVLLLKVFKFLKLKKYHFLVIAISLSALISLLGYRYYVATNYKHYPNLDSKISIFFAKLANLNYKIDENWDSNFYFENRIAEISDSIDVQALYQFEKEFKILFIGSSQTEGAGASLRHNGFPERIDQILKERFKEDNVLIKSINTGISGANSSVLLQEYQNRWHIYDPDLILINLSNNDADPELFKNNLQTFIKLSEINNNKIIFILEANTMLKSKNKLPLHDIMIDLSNTFNIPFIDLHSYIHSMENTGMVWWDDVHFTDYGLDIAANHIATEVKKIILDELKSEKNE